MEEIIEIKKGESPYKIIRSAWLEDAKGAVLFKLLSKKRLDGKIGIVYLAERINGEKIVLSRSIVGEMEFADAVYAFRSTVWKFFPEANLETEDFKLPEFFFSTSTSQYLVAENGKRGFSWLKIKKWLRII